MDQPPGVPNPTQNPKAGQCYATNPGKQIPGLAVLVGKVSGWLFATEDPRTAPVGCGVLGDLIALRFDGAGSGILGCDDGGLGT